MTSGSSRLAWVPGFATMLSLIACYGTLAVVAILGALGVTIALNETLWAGAIVTFSVLAVGGLALGFSAHRRLWPLLIGGLGAAAIGYAMVVQYLRVVELSGFALLCIAAVWDWQFRGVRKPGSGMAK